MTEVKVLVADPHPIVRTGLRLAFEGAGFEVVAEAETAAEAYEKANSGKPDVLILDITWPEENGLDFVARINEAQPTLPILIFTAEPEAQFAVRAMQLGAMGYVEKRARPEEILLAVRRLAAGRKYLSSELAEALAFSVVSKEKPTLHRSLSDREFQVLCMIAAGKKSSVIARELGLSIKTVSTHRARLLKKMGLKNNAQLVRYAITNGLV